VSKTEFSQFVDVIAGPYFEHMRASIVDSQLTLLVPILGAFRVVMHVREPGGAESARRTVFAIVQANLFRGRSIAPGHKFDLKGKSRAQKKGAPNAGAGAPGASVAQAPLTSEMKTPLAAAELESDLGRVGDLQATAEAVDTLGISSSSSVVLFDDDFLAMNQGLPFPLTDDAMNAFSSAVRRDAEFLREIGVVDYSLLAGIDHLSGEAVVGIIDYLRLFDTIKRLESLGKRLVEADPTVIAPGPYMERFCKALSRYFVGVPSKWSRPADASTQHFSAAAPPVELAGAPLPTAGAHSRLPVDLPGIASSASVI
jgi:hypothetical protein